MATKMRTTDQRGRVSLPKDFANCTVLIDRISETELRIRKAQVLPIDEIRFYEDFVRPFSERDRDAFLAMLDNPRRANKAFRGAAARHKRRLE